MPDRAYTKGATASTGDCGSVAQKKLRPALTGNGCRQVVRATYTNGEVAVTVGIAVFDTKAAAEKAKAAAGPFLVSLPGDGVERFCRATACRSTSNAIGRYGYFTIAGNTDGSPVRPDDTKARQAGLDVAEHAFSRIMRRANAQASAAGERPGVSGGHGRLTHAPGLTPAAPARHPRTPPRPRPGTTTRPAPHQRRHPPPHPSHPRPDLRRSGTPSRRAGRSSDGSAAGPPARDPSSEPPPRSPSAQRALPRTLAPRRNTHPLPRARPRGRTKGQKVVVWSTIVGHCISPHA